MSLIVQLQTQAFKEGYRGTEINAKVCQDIILMAISKSTLSRNVTIKGGVVMRSISNNIRRATQDLDIDFIRYSLSDESIERFIKTINCLEGITIKRVGRITQLSHQDYNGKRIYVEISDSEGLSLQTKMDLGVHKYLDINQKEYCFEIVKDKEGINLLINSFEQIFVEKLKSILKFGSYSTRYKDFYDLYYLRNKLNYKEISKCLDVFVFEDEGMRENTVDDIIKRLRRIEDDNKFLNELKKSKNNWLSVNLNTVIKEIINTISKIH